VRDEWGHPTRRFEEVVMEQRRDFIGLYATLIIVGIVVFLVGIVVLNQRA
jgi:hypothetical protein